MGNKVEKIGKAYGLPIVVVVNPMGFRCGYVGVPKGHPLYGADLGDPIPFLKASPGSYFEVHGGITYAGGGDYPIDNPSEFFWLGFDCCHCYDGIDLTLTSEEYLQAYQKYPRNSTGEVRSLDYVLSECNNLAKQLRSVEEMAGKLQ